MARRAIRPAPQRTPLRQPDLNIEGFTEYAGRQKCLKIITRSLARAGLNSDALRPYQRDIRRDLEDGLDEEALADMLAYWTYDNKKLFEEGGASYGRPMRPRIEIIIEMTSRGNLKAEWYPKGWDRWGRTEGEDTDFLSFHRFENRHIGYHSRPSNELFFIHEVRHALNIFYLAEDPEWSRPTDVIDHILLAACKGLVEDLKARLEPHFRVEMLTDIFMEWQRSEFIGKTWDETPAKVLAWAIDDPKVRQAQAEKLEIEEYEQRHGFTCEAMLEVWRRLAGPDAPKHTLPEDVSAARIVKAMKADGLPGTPKKVENAMALLRKHYVPRIGFDRV